MNAQAINDPAAADVDTRGETAGGWDAEAYGSNARFVADMAASLIDWLDPQAGERILDLGCGDGELTLSIVRRGANVLAMDSSPEFVRAAGGRGLDAIQGDGQSLADNPRLEGQFDAVFSNAALHWMHRDPQAVINGVFERLRPGGRFVAEFGGAGNVAPIHAALRDEAELRGQSAGDLDPWFFPEEEIYMEQLRSAGFSIDRHELFERPTRLPGDVSAWLETLARPFVHAFADAAQRADYVAAVRQRLLPHMHSEDGRWIAPYVRLRFAARKPA